MVLPRLKGQWTSSLVEQQACLLCLSAYARKIQIIPIELILRQITVAGSHALNQNVPQALDVLLASGMASRGPIRNRRRSPISQRILAQKSRRTASKCSFRAVASLRRSRIKSQGSSGQCQKSCSRIQFAKIICPQLTDHMHAQQSS